MTRIDQTCLLRIFTGEEDRYQGKPLYEQIVLEASRLRLAGATVIRGIMGFGVKSHLHSAKLLRLSENLPVIIEIADRRDNLEKIFSFLQEAAGEALVTLEPVEIIQNGQSQQE